MRDRRHLFVVAALLGVIALLGARLLTRIVTAVGEPPDALPATCGNGIADPPEQCDPPGSITCPPGSPAAAFLPCSGNCTCPTPTTTTTSTTTTTLPPLDHFECYEIKPGAFVNQSATVQDQFGTIIEMIRFPHRLCNPTSKNGGGGIAPPDHPAGDVVKAAPFPKNPHQTIQNQFGTTQVDVVRPDVRMVPPSKDGVPQIPPLDHFQCYKVKRSKGAPKFTKRTVTIANQFETNITVTVVKPVRLCAPANKNGEDPNAPTHPEHLLCYKTNGTPFGQSAHTIDNQFGFDDVTVIHRKELCLPSLKNPPTTTTTTTTHSTSSTTSTTTTTSSTTSTTKPYGSPSRAFLEEVPSLLE